MPLNGLVGFPRIYMYKLDLSDIFDVYCIGTLTLPA